MKLLKIMIFSLSIVSFMQVNGMQENPIKEKLQTLQQSLQALKNKLAMLSVKLNDLKIELDPNLIKTTFGEFRNTIKNIVEDCWNTNKYLYQNLKNDEKALVATVKLFQAIAAMDYLVVHESYPLDDSKYVYDKRDIQEQIVEYAKNFLEMFNQLVTEKTDISLKLTAEYDPKKEIKAIVMLGFNKNSDGYRAFAQRIFVPQDATPFHDFLVNNIMKDNRLKDKDSTNALEIVIILCDIFENTIIQRINAKILWRR